MPNYYVIKPLNDMEATNPLVDKTGQIGATISQMNELARRDPTAEIVKKKDTYELRPHKL